MGVGAGQYGTTLLGDTFGVLQVEQAPGHPGEPQVQLCLVRAFSGNPHLNITVGVLLGQGVGHVQPHLAVGVVGAGLPVEDPGEQAVAQVQRYLVGSPGVVQDVGGSATGGDHLQGIRHQ